MPASHQRIADLETQAAEAKITAELATAPQIRLQKKRLALEIEQAADRERQKLRSIKAD
mgnify:CR=1 FL=1